MSNKAIFLDRDDTLIDDPGYLSDPDQVKLLGGAARALVRFKAMGYLLVVVTNQSAVARGIITEKTLRKIHDRLELLLSKENAYLDAIYYCPYHPEGSVAKFRKKSNDRKPNPGMLLTAAKDLDIDLAQSWMVGNASHDVEAGLRAGCKTILIDLPSRQNQAKPGDPTPHFRAVNITEALNIIKKNNRLAKEPAPQEDKSAEKAEQEEEPAPAEDSSAEIPEQHDEPNANQVQAEKNPEPESPRPQPPVPPMQTTARALKSEYPVEEPASAPKVEQRHPPKDEHETAANHQKDVATTEQLLAGILDQLKSSNRSEMFDESFSAWRFMAGAVQGLVALCMLITIWLLMSPERNDTSVLIALGFATVLQLMALTFYMIRERK